MKKIYFNPFNEKTFLSNHNYERLLKEQNMCQKYQRNISCKYEDIILLYNQLVLKIVELMDYIKKTNSDLTLALLMQKLIHKGYFSYNNVFKKDENPKQEIDYVYGINIILGSGCCRNISDFYTDIFGFLYDYKLFYNCYMTDYKHNPLSKIKARANHEINLVRHHDNLYGIDLYNKILFTFESMYKMHSIYDDDHTFLTYKPTDEIIENLSSKKEIFDNLINFEYCAKRKPLSMEEYINIQRQALDLYDEKEKILESFNEDNKILKEKIKEKMLFLK